MAKGLEKGREEGLAKGLEKGREEGLAKGLEKGMAKGLEKGREEGLAKGMEKGREEGMEKEKLSTARRLLSMGLSEEQVSTATELPLEEIQKLRE